MNSLLLLVSALIILIAVALLAYYIQWLPVDQVVATIASVTVATVGLFVFFKKSRR